MKDLTSLYVIFWCGPITWNTKKMASKIAHIRPNLFFSNANWPKSSPNLNSCSIKISRLLYNDFERARTRRCLVLLHSLGCEHDLCKPILIDFECFWHPLFCSISFVCTSTLSCVMISSCPMTIRNYLWHTLWRSILILLGIRWSRLIFRPEFFQNFDHYFEEFLI